MHTRKRELTGQLRPLSKATLKLLSVEVGCKVPRRGGMTFDATPAQLADFLMKNPISARRVVKLLQASKGQGFQAVAEVVTGIKGCGPLQVGAWTLTPVDGGLSLHSESAQAYACYSTDPRVGIIVLANPEAQSATQLAQAALPQAVRRAVGMMLEPLPSPVRAGKK